MKLLALLLLLLQQPATLRFDYHLPNGEPAEYSLTVDSSGKATFDEPATDKQDAYHSDFQLPGDIITHLFDQTKATNYFSGHYNYTRHKVANLGEKKLTYTSPAQQGSAAYNYSQDTHIQDLTDYFQSLAATQDFARRVQFDRRFDKLALDADVKAFAQQVAANQARSLETIRATLESLAKDSTVLNTVRQRARDLLKQVLPLPLRPPPDRKPPLRPCKPL